MILPRLSLIMLAGFLQANFSHTTALLTGQKAWSYPYFDPDPAGPLAGQAEKWKKVDTENLKVYSDIFADFQLTPVLEAMRHAASPYCALKNNLAMLVTTIGFFRNVDWILETSYDVPKLKEWAKWFKCLGAHGMIKTIIHLHDYSKSMCQLNNRWRKRAEYVLLLLVSELLFVAREDNSQKTVLTKFAHSFPGVYRVLECVPSEAFCVCHT